MNVASGQTGVSPQAGMLGETAAAFPIFLSIVVVDRDAGPDFARMLGEIVDTVRPLVTDFELIVVDNGSAPEARETLAALTAGDRLPNLQLFHLLQRVEAEIAYWAGIENSLGDYVLAFDPYNEDLSRLPQAIELALLGHDIVLLDNEETEATGAVQRVAASAFRRLYRLLYGVELRAEAAQHRLLSKTAITFLSQLPHPELRYRALPKIPGFRTATIRYRAPRRDKLDHSLGTRIGRAMTLLFSSSLMPLRVVSMLALFGSLANILYSFYVVAISLTRGDVAKGWTTLSLQQSGMFFLISLVLFVLTEYLIRIVQWTMTGSAYFIVREATSDVILRKSRLNVESSRADAA